MHLLDPDARPDAHNQLSYKSYDLLWRRPRRPWRRHAADLRRLVAVLLWRRPRCPDLPRRCCKKLEEMTSWT